MLPLCRSNRVNVRDEKSEQRKKCKFDPHSWRFSSIYWKLQRMCFSWFPYMKNGISYEEGVMFSLAYRVLYAWLHWQNNVLWSHAVLSFFISIPPQLLLGDNCFAKRSTCVSLKDHPLTLRAFFTSHEQLVMAFVCRRKGISEKNVSWKAVFAFVVWRHYLKWLEEAFLSDNVDHQSVPLLEICSAVPSFAVTLPIKTLFAKLFQNCNKFLQK